MAVKDLIEMKVTGLTIDPFTNMPIVILKDSKEKFTLPIWVGFIEASAIASEIENIKLSRPMTHDLLRNVLEMLGVKVIDVKVIDLADNTFYAKMSLEKDGKTMDVDCRPSDGIAVAMRSKSPILVSKVVIEKSRKIDMSLSAMDNDEERKKKWTEILESLSPEDFGKYKM